MTFDPPEGKAEGEPGRFCHMTSVMQRHPYIRYRRGRTRPRLCLCTLGSRRPALPWLKFRYLGSRRLFSRCCFARVRWVNRSQRKMFFISAILTIAPVTHTHISTIGATVRKKTWEQTETQTDRQTDRPTDRPTTNHRSLRIRARGLMS